jgi:uncharacterized membrane protein (DUF373 family)
MDKKSYRTFFLIAILFNVLLSTGLLIFSIVTLLNSLNEDNIIFTICFALLVIMEVFEAYALIRSYKNDSENVKHLLYDNKGNFQQSFFNLINVLLGAIGIIFIYDCFTIFYNNLLFGTFPTLLKTLIAAFCFYIITNIIFIDLYKNVYKYEENKAISHRE